MSCTSLKALIAVSSIMLLGACGGGGGGGGGEDSTPPASGNAAPPNAAPPTATPSPSQPPTQNPGQNPSSLPPQCTSAAEADFWLDRRVACLKEGTSVIDIAKGATGEIADRSFVVWQAVYNNFNNVLGPNRGRFYDRILCVKNAPRSLTESGNRLHLGADLVVALRAAGTFPSNYLIQTLLYSGSSSFTAFVEEPCDPGKHPIIINYSTGKIETLTPASVSNVKVYEGE